MRTPTDAAGAEAGGDGGRTGAVGAAACDGGDSATAVGSGSILVSSTLIACCLALFHSLHLGDDTFLTHPI